MIVYTPEEVCAKIDAFPNVHPVVAKGMKAAVRRGECPTAIRVSLKLKPIVCFTDIEENS